MNIFVYAYDRWIFAFLKNTYTFQITDRYNDELMTASCCSNELMTASSCINELMTASSCSNDLMTLTNIRLEGLCCSLYCCNRNGIQIRNTISTCTEGGELVNL